MGYYNTGKKAPKVRRSGAITNSSVRSGVDGGKLSPGSLPTLALADGAVTTSKLAGAAVTTAKVAAAAIVNSLLADGSVSDSKVGTGINGGKLTAATVDTLQLANNAVTDSKVATGLDATKVTHGSLDGSLLAATSVANAALGTGIDGAKLSAATVTGAKIANNTIAEANVVAGSLTDASISGAAGISGTKLGAGTVAADRLITHTLTHNEISLTAGIQGSQLDAAAAIADGQIAGLNGSKLTAGTVANAALASGIDLAKLSSVAGSLLSPSLVDTGYDGTKLAGLSVTNAQISASAGIVGSKLSASAGILGSQLDAAAGIASGQIAGLAASKLTGTVANSQLASGIDPSKLTGSGTVPLAGLSGITHSQLSGGAGIQQGQLENFLRSGLRYKALLDQFIASSSPIPFGTCVYDGLVQGAGQPNGTNLCLQSETFDNASWTKTGIGSAAPTVTANSTVAPDLSTTADSLVFPAVGAGQTSIVSQGGTMTADPYTFSVWLKVASGTKTVFLMVFNGATYYSLAVGVTTTWQRFVLTTSALTAAGWTVAIGTDLRDATQSTQAAQTIIAWGAQVEQAKGAGPYVKTTTATKTAQPSTYPTPGETTFTPEASGTWHWQAKVRLAGGDITPGLGAFLQVYDNTAAAVVATGQMCPVFTDMLASGFSGADVIDAVLNESFSVTAGHSYSLLYVLPRSWHVNVVEPGGGDWVLGGATVKADAADQTGTYTVPGSWLQVDPVTQ